MKLHEFQSKDILSKQNVNVPKGVVITEPVEAWVAAKQLGLPVILKAQVHAGGRGEAGGVKIAKTTAEAEAIANAMIGMKLVTKQTGSEGKVVKRLLVEKTAHIKKEFYISISIDRISGRPMFLASKEGGMAIEEVAEKNPDAIFQRVIDPATGIVPSQAREIAYSLGLGEQVKQTAKLIISIYNVFMDSDASMIELNPFILTDEGDIVALDAKIDIDDSALFRHKDIAKLRDITEESETETKSSFYGLSFVQLDGNIGCMVNGAGLAMATMDLIKISGGNPANFLDIGGGAGKEKVTRAFSLILQDKNIKAILINIFGGITRCDEVANGIVAAAKELKLELPMAVRLKGANFEEGSRILKESGLKFEVFDSLNEAALASVKMTNA